MAYQITNWMGSEWKQDREIPIEPGSYDVYIKGASYDQELNRYRITVEDVQTGQTGMFSWYTVTRTGDVNKISVGALTELGKALFNSEVGVPFPDDVKGGVVHTEIVMGKPYVNGKGDTVQYPQIQSFAPVSKDIYVLVAESGRDIIEQYTKDAEGSA